MSSEPTVNPEHFWSDPKKQNPSNLKRNLFFREKGTWHILEHSTVLKVVLKWSMGVYIKYTVSLLPHKFVVTSLTILAFVQWYQHQFLNLSSPTKIILFSSSFVLGLDFLVIIEKNCMRDINQKNKVSIITYVNLTSSVSVSLFW